MANIVRMVIQLRRASTAEWLANKDVIPAQGEPCFDYELNTLKIGDGVKTYKQLDPIGGATVSADGTSIVLEDGVFKLAGYDAAAVGAQLRKGENGLEWVVPTVDIEELQDTVTEIKDIVMPSGDGAETLLSRVENLEKEVDTIVSGLTDDGKVNTMMELIEYIETHGKEAADMASDIFTLQELVGNDPVADQIVNAISASEEKAKATFEHVKYEVSDKPYGTLVDYRDKEIRVMVPADTQFELQNSGANADANAYYIGFKAFAPDGAVNFKEDLAEIIADSTVYSFDNNEFAGVDAYGRKYSIIWLPVAKYDADADAWTYYGANSSKEYYIGWYYSVEWYDAAGKCIDSDCIRINLSNETCHNTIEPYYMANVVKSVSVNGAVLDMVDGKVNVTTANIVKSSDEIEVAEDGSLSVKSISFDKITQDENSVLVMDGGSAAG